MLPSISIDDERFAGHDALMALQEAWLVLQPRICFDADGVWIPLQEVWLVWQPRIRFSPRPERRLGRLDGVFEALERHLASPEQQVGSPERCLERLECRDNGQVRGDR